MIMTISSFQTTIAPETFRLRAKALCALPIASPDSDAKDYAPLSHSNASPVSHPSQHSTESSINTRLRDHLIPFNNLRIQSPASTQTTFKLKWILSLLSSPTISSPPTLLKRKRLSRSPTKIKVEVEVRDALLPDGLTCSLLQVLL
jgi:hypothetical protein